MIPDEFMLTLPSNGSASVFPDNIPSSYKIILPKTLDLEGEWEMAIVNIQYPFNWPNYLEDYVALALNIPKNIQEPTNLRDDYAKSCERNLTDFLDDEKARKCLIVVGEYMNKSGLDGLTFKIIKIPTSYYKAPFDLANYITNKFNENCPADYQVKCFSDPFMQTISFLPSKYGKPELYTLNSRLHSALGIQQTKLGDSLFVGKTLNSPTKTNMENFTTMYVYCNAIKYQIVGDTQAPLLASLAIQGKPGEQCYWGFNPPLYIPLSQKTISSLEIKLCTDSGDLFPFHPRGRVIVQLHLRRHRAIW